MRAQSQSGSPKWIGIAFLPFVIWFAFGCSKSNESTSREIPPASPHASLVAATVPAPAPAPIVATIATPKQPTAAERLVEIDRLLARPLTGTPESADERTLLRAERAALISSGQVPPQSSDPAPVQSSPAPVVQYSGTDAPNGQIAIATSSSSLPFLEQMTPSERDHYFQELWLQNGSFVDVNDSGFGFGRFGVNHRRPNMRPPPRAPIASQPVHRGR